MGVSPYYWFNQYSQHQADVRNNKLKHPWNGPIKQAYIFPDRDPIVLDITNSADMYRISTLDTKGMIGFVTQSSDGTWNGQYFHPGEDRYGMVIYLHGDKGGKSLEEIQAKVRDGYNTTKAEEERIAADPALQLERELENNDWYSHMSDDHAHWSAGERSSRKIKALVAKVPADTVRTLWAKYAPEGFTCPV